MSERLRLDLVLNDFVASAVVARRISVLSDGTPWRPLIHVSDMARAIEWALQRDLEAVGPFVLVNTGVESWNYRVKALAEAVARMIPGTEIEMNKQAQPDKRSYRVDFSLFRRLAPNHQPRVTLEQAIVELREALEAMGFDDREFRKSQLMRLNTLLILREQGRLNRKLEWKDRRSVLP
jgi:nucleoside-diphosphate-sugar epimerase